MKSSPPISPSPRLRGCVSTVASRPTMELLERRALFAIAVQIDYSLDTNNFFSDPVRRDTLQAVADAIAAHFGDQLAAITPGGSNTWGTKIPHPGTGATTDLPNLSVPANTVVVFA